MIGHVERTRPLRDYCTGLMLPGERKSVEPMAARTAPGRTAAQHQSLLHFVANAAWSDEDVLARCARWCCRRSRRADRSRCGSSTTPPFPKQGKHSVGVHHQYCGQLGKQANCQVAVSLSIANHSASLPVAYRLYLPKDWAKDRCASATRPACPWSIGFKTKPEIALEQIRWACEAGLPRGCRADGRRLWQLTRDCVPSITALGTDLRRRHSAEHHWYGHPARAVHRSGAGRAAEQYRASRTNPS